MCFESCDRRHSGDGWLACIQIWGIGFGSYDIASFRWQLPCIHAATRHVVWELGTYMLLQGPDQSAWSLSHCISPREWQGQCWLGWICQWCLCSHSLLDCRRHWCYQRNGSNWRHRKPAISNQQQCQFKQCLMAPHVLSCRRPYAFFMFWCFQKIRSSS